MFFKLYWNNIENTANLAEPLKNAARDQCMYVSYALLYRDLIQFFFKGRYLLLCLFVVL